MPNWCSNSLTITGPDKDIVDFVKSAEGSTNRYNDYYTQDDWGNLDEIRVKALFQDGVMHQGSNSPLSFHQICPVPEDILKLGYDEGVAKKVANIVGVEYPGYGGYNWQIQNWGTKWQPEVYHNEYHSGFASYDFDTAWSPPLALILHASRRWPNLNFHISYREEGMAYEGGMTCEGGEVISEWEDEIPHEEPHE